MERKKFTLIELLIVIAIISILAAMLLPSLSKTKQTALKAQCVSNQRQISQALLQYAEDNQGFGPRLYGIPQHIKLECGFESYFFGGKAAKYPIRVLECPAAKCNDPSVLYRAGTRMGGANLHTDFSFALGTGGVYSNGYGFYDYAVSSGMTKRYAVPNLGYFGKRIADKYDYRFSPSDYAMMNDMENGTRQPTKYGDHGNKELPHGITGVNVSFFDGHVRFVPFKEAKREINFGGKIRW